MIDMDYIDKLNDKEKEFLNSVISEEILADFSHAGKKLIKTKAGRRVKYNENNARNRDSYAITQATGNLLFTEDFASLIENNQIINKDSMEDAMIDMIDAKNARITSEEKDPSDEDVT